MRHFKVLAAVVLAAMFTQGFPVADATTHTTAPWRESRAAHTQSFPVADAADENVTPKAERARVAYDVADFPVYSQDGKQFDPSILIAFVKATVDPESWEIGSSTINTNAFVRAAVDPQPGEKGPSIIYANAAKRVLIITTTEKNHEAIIDSLKRFRSARDKQQD